MLSKIILLILIIGFSSLIIRFAWKILSIFLMFAWALIQIPVRIVTAPFRG